MKTLMAICGAMLMALTVMPTSASAWYCRATGSSGAWGWGSSGSLSAAKSRALAECAVRTPRNHVCYIRYCR